MSASVVTTTDTSSIDELIAKYALIPALIAKYAALIEAAAKRYVHVDTGAMRDSIHTVLEGMSAEIIAGEGLTYGAILEYGGATRAAYPFMRPAFERYAPSFILELQSLIGGV